MGCRLPEVEDEIKLMEMYGAKTLAVTLNGDGGDSEGLATYQKELSEKLQIPVIRPLEEGVEALLADIRQFMEKG